MRRLRSHPLADSVVLPRSSSIVGVSIGRLLVSYDDADTETETRRFKELRDGDPVPPGAVCVGGYATPLDGWAAVFELGEEIPADLPVEMHGHYRTLIRDGFTLRADRAWLAPDDIPAGQMGVEQIIAVASLQEYGYGSVVNA